MHEIEKNTERAEINLTTFQAYEVDDKKRGDSLNYWMFFPMYAVVYSESPAIAVQKYTVFVINLMVYMMILSFCFADYTFPEVIFVHFVKK